MKEINFDKLSFEEAVEMLEKIVDELNEPTTTLDASLELFEKGTKLVKICKTKLNDAKIKITELEKD